MVVCSVYVECRKEVAVYKWLESEKVQFDIGEEVAVRHWVKDHWTGYCRAKLLEHFQGITFWSELDKSDYGLLQRAFHDQQLLLDRILDRLKVGQENLDILLWAQDWNISIDDVIAILEVLDINSRRLSPRFDIF